MCREVEKNSAVRESERRRESSSSSIRRERERELYSSHSNTRLSHRANTSRVTHEVKLNKCCARLDGDARDTLLPSSLTTSNKTLLGESIRRVHDDACRSPLCLSCLREFRGLGHAVGSRFTLLESKGRAFCSISQRIAVRRRAVFSFPVTVCARARASSRKTRARWRTERLGRGFFRSSVRDKYVALNGARRTDDTSNETRTTGGARKDGKRSPPVLLLAKYIIFSRYIIRCSDAFEVSFVSFAVPSSLATHKSPPSTFTRPLL